MAAQQRAPGIFARIQSLVDKVVSPSTREQYYKSTTTFAKEQPFLFVSIHHSAMLSPSITPQSLTTHTVLPPRPAPRLLDTTSNLHLLRAWHTRPLHRHRTRILHLLDRCCAPHSHSHALHNFWSGLRVLGLGCEQLSGYEMGLQCCAD